MQSKDLASQIERFRRQLQLNQTNSHLYLCVGLLYEENGQDIDAIRAYEQAVTFSPNIPKFLFPLGLCYTNIGRFDLAMNYFNKAISLDIYFYKNLQNLKYDNDFPFIVFKKRIDTSVETYKNMIQRNPGNISAYTNLATILLLIGETQESLAVLQSAVSINAQSADIYRLQSYAFQQSGLPELAVKSLEQALAIQPDNVETISRLGEIYYKIERYSLAQKQFEKVLSLDPKSIKALFGLGQVFSKTGRRDMAKEQYIKVIELLPKHSEAHFNLARHCEETYDLQGASRHYKIVIDLEPSNAEAYHGHGMACHRMGLANEAVPSFTKAVELAPHDPYFRYHLGQAYASIGEHASAIEQFNEAIHYNPSDSFIYNQLGISYEKLSNKVSAVFAFKKSIELKPDDAYAHYYLGLVYLADEQLSLAAGAFERVLELNPHDAFAYYNLGAAYARLGFLDKGIEAYQKAITLHPSSAYAHFNLGAAYAREGEPELAEDEFKKATALTPKNEEELALFATLNSQAFINIEMARLNKQLKELYTKTVEALILTLDAKDHYTAGHTSRVSSLSMKIGKQMGFSKDEMEGLRMGALLHDIGKIGIPENILLKKETLTKEEYEVMKAHPAIGFKILSPVKFPWKNVANHVKCHHEKVDGTGYPDGLMGDSIPIGAQIIGLADFFDALATERPYKPALPIPMVMEEIEKTIGKFFSEEVVNALKVCIDDSIYRMYASRSTIDRSATKEEIELWNVLS